VELNLSDLISSDAAGIEALQGLRSQGALLVGAPGYLQLKLDSPSPTGSPAAPDAGPPPKAGRPR